MAAEDHLGQQFLYHHTSPRNRASIEQHGLKGAWQFEDEGRTPEQERSGPVYLTDKPSGPHFKVDVGGLHLEDDHDEHTMDENWHAHYGEIPPHRLQWSG